MSNGVTIWFTGLSGVGKTTIARRVEEILAERGVRVERLDGDVVRQSLTRDLGFSKEDRDKNIERVTFVAKVLTRNGVVVLTSFISPYRRMRDAARREIGSFLEVYLYAPLEELERRDVKGMYKKAREGLIPNFSGVNDPYEAPIDPELAIDTTSETPEQSSWRVVRLIDAFLKRDGAGVQRRTVSGLVDRMAVRPAHLGSLPKVRLDARELADLEMIGNGALSPLTGFMRRADYECVVENLRLSDGLLWPLPVTLSVDDSVRAGEEVALVGGDAIVGIMQVTEVFAYDKELEAQRVFGTTQEAHPGVARLYAQKQFLAGGPVHVFADALPREFSSYRLPPKETRAVFAAKGWKTVVGFQTRNPVHRAHEYLLKTALETIDGLLLHPLVGATKSDDVPPDVRLKSYEALLANYFPRERVLLSAFPAAMRYAGPREALFHAIARKNYGCTHFIVGRDHAGVGNYYGTYAAHELVSKYADELGIVPLLMEHTFYCTRCEAMASTRTCPHGEKTRVALSGTKVRELLAAGEELPREFSRPEVSEVLAEAYNQLSPDPA
jgi:sulfate adenylyltransferase